MPSSDNGASDKEAVDQLLLFNATTLAVFRTAMHISPSQFTTAETLVIQAVSIGHYSGTPFTAYSIEGLTGLPHSTVRRILSSFVKRGIVEPLRNDNKAQYRFTISFGNTEAVRWFTDNVGKSIRQILRGRNGTNQI